MATVDRDGYIQGSPGSALDGILAGRLPAAGSVAGGIVFGSLPAGIDTGGFVATKPASDIAGLLSGAMVSTAAGMVIGGDPDTFGLAIPLSDPVPLRNSTVWGQFVSPAPLPIGYGQIAVTPIPYDTTGRLFFLLDHAIQAIDSLTRDDVADTQYTLENSIDGNGHAVALLRLARPASANEKLVVTLRGRMHPDTGELLLNPADILWDLLANVCNLPVNYSDVDTFRCACRDLGIELHGLLQSDTITIRAQVDEIMASSGAVWSGGMPGVARIYPI